MLVPKWFDKSPALSNEDNFDQLRLSLRMAATSLQAAGENTPFGLSAAVDGPHHAVCAAIGLNGLVASFGLALIDRAIIDALGRLEGASVFALIRANRLGLDATTATDLAGFDFDRLLGGADAGGRASTRAIPSGCSTRSRRPKPRASGSTTACRRAWRKCRRVRPSLFQAEGRRRHRGGPARLIADRRGARSCRSSPIR